MPFLPMPPPCPASAGVSSVHSEKITCLEFFDMYFIVGGISSQLLVLCI
jgi:hypothetical protein